MPVNDYVAERLCELREEAYCRVLKCFVASQTYDLKKELMLSQLRAELHVSDDRHLELRQSVASGEERPWIKSKPMGGSGPRGGYAEELSEDDSPSPQHRDQYGAPPSHAGSPFDQRKGGTGPGSGIKPAKKRPKKGSAEPDLRGGGHAAPAGGSGGQVMGMNPLVGHKVDRYWAEDHKWWRGIITDYNGLTGEHCIVYDAGTALESYEWLDVRSSSDAELRVLEEKVNVLDLPSPPGAQAVNYGGDPGAYTSHDHISHSKRGGGHGGRKSGMGAGGRGTLKSGYQDMGPPLQQSYLASQAAKQFETISSGDDDY